MHVRCFGIVADRQLQRHAEVEVPNLNRIYLVPVAPLAFFKQIIDRAAGAAGSILCGRWPVAPGLRIPAAFGMLFKAELVNDGLRRRIDV